MTKERKHRWYLTKRRPLKLDGKFCKVCEIRLLSKYAGLRVRKYCKDCQIKGLARKHAKKLQNDRYYLKHRSTILARQKKTKSILSPYQLETHNESPTRKESVH